MSFGLLISSRTQLTTGMTGIATPLLITSAKSHAEPRVTKNYPKSVCTSKLCFQKIAK